MNPTLSDKLLSGSRDDVIISINKLTPEEIKANFDDPKIWRSLSDELGSYLYQPIGRVQFIFDTLIKKISPDSKHYQVLIGQMFHYSNGNLDSKNIHTLIRLLRDETMKGAMELSDRWTIDDFWNKTVTLGAAAYVFKRIQSNPQLFPPDSVRSAIINAVNAGLYSSMLSEETTIALLPLLEQCLTAGKAMTDLLPSPDFYSFASSKPANVGRFIASVASLYLKHNEALPPAQIKNMKDAKEALIVHYQALVNKEDKQKFLNDACNKNTPLGKIFAAKRGIRGTLEGSLNILKRLARDNDGLEPMTVSKQELDTNVKPSAPPLEEPTYTTAEVMKPQVAVLVKDDEDKDEYTSFTNKRF